MKIKLDDKHFLNSDPYCYWITVLVKNEKNPKYFYFGDENDEPGKVC